MWQALSTTILFSVSGVCAQRTSVLLGGVTANFCRIWVAGLLLATWAHWAGQGLSGPALPLFFVSGVVGFGFGDLALYQALPRIGSRLSVLLVHCVAAPCGALTEWIWLGTPMSTGEVSAAGVILAGVALALAPEKGAARGRGRRVLWTGVAYALAASVGQAMGAVLSRKAGAVAAAAGAPMDGMTAAYQRIIGGILVGTLFFVVLRWRQSGRTGERAGGAGGLAKAWPWVLANALTGPGLGVAMFQWALLSKGTGVVLPIVALTPLVIIPFSRVVEGERPSRRSLLGCLVAVAGVIGLVLQ